MLMNDRGRLLPPSGRVSIVPPQRGTHTLQTALLRTPIRVVTMKFTENPFAVT
jgi:hypothetical protein